VPDVEYTPHENTKAKPQVGEIEKLTAKREGESYAGIKSLSSATVITVCPYLLYTLHTFCCNTRLDIF